jgi:serine/threonine-protein kinase
MAFSSNGEFVVYSAIRENPWPQTKPQIYLRRLDRTEAAPVPGTEGGISPFLSPDDRWIGFWEGGKLKKIPVSGGVSTTLCDATGPNAADWPYNDVLGADWGADNRIVFCHEVGFGLSWISADGGSPEALTTPDKTRQEYDHRLPHYVPGGRGVLFTVPAYGHDLTPRLALLDLATRHWRVLMEDAADGRYLRTGHLVFLRQGTLMAAPFDLDRRETRGRPVPVVANVMQALNLGALGHNTGAGQYGVSDSGWLAYVPGGILPDNENSLVRVDLEGNIRPVADFQEAFFAPRFSPDGQRIAYCTLARVKQVKIYDLRRGTATPLTNEGRASFPTWTPNGESVVFKWSKLAAYELCWQASDGSSPMKHLAAGFQPIAGSFTPEGSTVAFVDYHPQTGADILLLDMKSRRVKPFLCSKAAERYPEISPNGRWLSYVSDESGRAEVWVRPFPGEGGKWQISNAGGTEPIWSKDGQRLFYRQSARVWVADVRAENGFSVGRPRVLFEQAGFGFADPVRSWDLAPDGRSFLMVKHGEAKPEPVTEMILVQNWLEELKRLCPTEK